MIYASIHHLVQSQAQQIPEAVAIVAPARNALTYADLYRHIHHIGVQLNDFGIGRNDRVGIILPNGPEMATAFLSVAASSATAGRDPRASGRP